MAASFPTSVKTFLEISETTEQDDVNCYHDLRHNSEAEEIVAVQTKIGTGDSTPTTGTVLRGTGTGTSAWADVVLTTDVTGALPVANGGTGSTSAADARTALDVVGVSDTQTLTNKTLTTPKFADGGYLADTSGNEILSFDTVSSPVNYVQVTQAVSTEGPRITAKGDDDNVDLNIDSKGTAGISFYKDGGSTTLVEIESGGDLNLDTVGANIQINNADPKRAFYIPASGMFGATTTGAASGQGESSSNKVNYKTLDFDTSADEYACFSIPAPLNWDLGTVTAQFYWTSAGGTPDQTVTWAIQGVALSNDDALDTAYGTAVTVADTLIAAGDVHVSAATAAITIAGTPAAGDALFFRIYRDVSEDNVSDDARLIGVRIEYGISKYSDQS